MTGTEDSSSSQKSGGNQGANPPNQLWVEAVVAETIKKLKATNLFESPHVEPAAEAEDSQAARRREIKAGKKQVIHEVTNEFAAFADEEEEELLQGVTEYPTHRRPANRRAPVRDEDIMMGYHTPRRPPQRRQPPRYAADEAEPDDNLGNIKLRIPAFEGKNDPDAYLEWEKKMENVFDVQNFSEAKKVRLAATEFSGYALSWWDQITTIRRRTGEAQVNSWFELKTLMQRRFVPVYYNKEVHNKLRRLTQGLKSVDDYFQEMETLMIRADIDEDENATMARFLAGLNR